MDNEAIYMTGIKKVEIRDCEMPQAGEGELVIKVQYVGLCGSDLHFFEAGRIGSKVIDRPFILGHECSGVVSEVGKNVKGFCPGDCVVVEPGVPCGKCIFCKMGRYNLCDEMNFKSSPPNNGFLRRYVAHPASMTYHLSDHISLTEGAMIEPLAVAMHAAKRGGIELGKTAAILGSGTIGLMTILACRAMGASRIIVSDIFENRLEKAKKMGADELIDASKRNTEETIMELTDGQGADVVFETAGSSITVTQTAMVAKKGGKIVLIGNITDEARFNFLRIATREVDIVTIFRYCNIFASALDALATGRIRLDYLNPRIYDFNQAHQAFLEAIENKKDIVKAIIKVG